MQFVNCRHLTIQRTAILIREPADIGRLVTYEVDPEDPYPARFTGHIRIEMSGGGIHEMRQDHMRGGVDEPLSRAEIDAKFLANARHGGIADAERLLDACGAVLDSAKASDVIATLATKENAGE